MAEYIEREAAKRYLALDYAYAAAELLDKVDAADVAPVVHGRWDLYGTHYCCSKCLVTLRDKVPYCPNCGARMDGE